MADSLVIPLAGYGKRFTKAGYKTLKPFLNVDQENNMLDLIVRNFPKNIKKIFIVRKNIERKYLNFLKKYKNSKIYFIDSHNLGPLYSVYLAKNNFRGIKNIFLSYCDIDWNWKNSKVKNSQSNYVYCFKGWHPFTTDNNNYAFCKIKKNRIISIKEKESFTNKWQEEPLSVGLFFFKKGEEMICNFENIIKKKIKVNSEYFPSLAFNSINNKKVKFVENFCHIGNPIYFEIYKKWNKFNKIKISFKKEIKKINLADEIIISAAGTGQRFLKENIKVPKFLCKAGIEKKNMINLIKDYLPGNKKIQLVTLNQNQKFLKNKFKVTSLKKKTNGQASTVMKILNEISINKSIFVNSCDTFSIFDTKLFRSLKKKSDIIVFTSENYETDSMTNEGSWVRSKRNKVKNIYIKAPKIRSTERLTGNFYFKNKNIFIKCYKKNIKNKIKKEILIDDLVKTAVKMKFKVYSIKDKVYVNMGTPKLLREFNFWENYFNVN